MPRCLETLRVCPYRFRVATTYRIPTLTSRREFFRLPYPVTTRRHARGRRN